jgi:hypothetical protein
LPLQDNNQLKYNYSVEFKADGTGGGREGERGETNMHSFVTLNFFIHI